MADQAQPPDKTIPVMSAPNPVVRGLAARGVQDAAADGAESFLDAVLTGQTLDHVPVVGTLRGIAIAFATGRDQWLQNKLGALLAGIGEVSEKDVQRWRQRTRQDDDSVETAERVIGVFDAASSRLKAELIGRAFRQYLDGSCDSITLRRTVDIIDKALAEDLRALCDKGTEDLEPGVFKRLETIGLVTGGPSTYVSGGEEPKALGIEGQLIFA